MGRYGSTENDEPYEEIEWAGLRRRPIKPRVKPSFEKKSNEQSRSTTSKTISAKKKRVKLRSDRLMVTMRPEQTEERSARTIKNEVRRVVVATPSITVKALKLQFPDISTLLLSSLKAEIRRQLKLRIKVHLE